MESDLCAMIRREFNYQIATDPIPVILSVTGDRVEVELKLLIIVILCERDIPVI